MAGNIDQVEDGFSNVVKIRGVQIPPSKYQLANKCHNLGFKYGTVCPELWADLKKKISKSIKRLAMKLEDIKNQIP